MKTLTPQISVLVTTLAAVGPAWSHAGHLHGKAAKPALICPVTKTAIPDATKALRVMVNNRPVLLCCSDCPTAFRKNPTKWVKSAQDPVSRKTFKVTAKTPVVQRQGAVFLFSSAKTRELFLNAPAKYIHG